jgi:hypothetical protein
MLCKYTEYKNNLKYLRMFLYICNLFSQFAEISIVYLAFNLIYGSLLSRISYIYFSAFYGSSDNHIPNV